MKGYILPVIILISSTCFGQVYNRHATKQLKETSNAVFEENRGQIKDQFWKARPDVLFHGHSNGMNYYLRDKGISYQLMRVETWVDKNKLISNEANANCNQVPDQIGTYRVDAEWVNANTDFTIVKGKPLAGYNNYYNVPKGADPALFVKQYESITFKNVWDGIDLHYYGTDGLLETDYMVAPGADYRNIKIHYKGADLSTDFNGKLIIKTPFGEIHEGELKVYQNNELLEASWSISKNNEVSFIIPHYNAELALRIDPLTRAWGTYYGGVASEYVYSCTTDSSANVYLAGATTSTTSIASGGHQNTFGAGPGFEDAFLVMFNSSGARLWGTYYGEQGDEDGTSCSVDDLGNVYLAGSTSSTTAIATGGHQNTYGGGLFGTYDAFLVKFNSLGVRIWGTYYGDTGQDFGRSCAVDPSGNVYLAGSTQSTSSIAANGHQNAPVGPVYNDAFLAKFSSSGNRLWGTYYGDSGVDAGWSCATDSFGNVFLAGRTYSTIGIASNGHQNSFAGSTASNGGDAFLVKFNSSGLRQWGTYYGGPNYESGFSCTADGAGNIYLAGATSSTTAIASGGHLNTISSSSSIYAFLAKFDNAGTRLWGTYYGPLNNTTPGSSDRPNCAVDALDNVYLSGTTDINQNIATNNGYQSAYSGSIDAFLVKFNGSGVRQWGTYYGGGDYDYSSTCNIDINGDIYLAGITKSTSNIASGGHQNTFGGGNVSDGYLVKFNETVTSLVDNSNKVFSIKLFPNPANSIVSLVVNTLTETTTNIRISDMQGRVLLNETKELQPGKNIINYNINALESGRYLVQVSNNNGQSVIDLVKE